jgi:Ca-activated chloride channel family protein
MIAAVRYITRGTGTARPQDLPPADLRGLSAAAAAFRVAENVVTQLGAANGRRKIVAWFSPPAQFMGGDPDAAVAQRDALRAAARHNVAIYAIDTRGLTTTLGRGLLERKAAYQGIADETGGEAIIDSNNFGAAFQQFLRDSSSYYLLTYEPAVEHLDGKFHPIVVRVRRNGVSVRARSGYYAPEAGR